MDIRKVLTAATMVGALVYGNACFAQEKTPGSGPNPYTDCGIGAALFSDTKWAAVTSNVIWDLGITAITSATASPQTCSGKKVVTALFVGKTYANLTEETAVGQGEHLTTVLNLFGCDSTRHASAIADTRREMGQVVADPSYADQTQLEKAAKYYNVVEKAVGARCSA